MDFSMDNVLLSQVFSQPEFSIFISYFSLNLDNNITEEFENQDQKEEG